MSGRIKFLQPIHYFIEVVFFKEIIQLEGHCLFTFKLLLLHLEFFKNFILPEKVYLQTESIDPRGNANPSSCFCGQILGTEMQSVLLRWLGSLMLSVLISENGIFVLIFGLRLAVKYSGSLFEEKMQYIKTGGDEKKEKNPA